MSMLWSDPVAQLALAVCLEADYQATIAAHPEYGPRHEVTDARAREWFLSSWCGVHVFGGRPLLPCPVIVRERQCARDLEVTWTPGPGAEMAPRGVVPGRDETYPAEGEPVVRDER